VKIILASRSPRRRECLRDLGLHFTAVDPGEDYAPEHADVLTEAQAVQFALDAARHKGAEVAHKHRDALVISADTIVFLGKRIYGKPKDVDDARKALRALYGKTHIVITALALFVGDERASGCERTEVTFGMLSEAEETAFIKLAQVMDKAGSYAIQGVGGVLVTGICGDYFNVVGMPVNLLDRLIKEARLPGLLELAQH
jgi:septum formation protein